MEQYSSMALEVAVKKEETDDSFSTVSYNPVTALEGQPSIKEEEDQLLIVKTEPVDHHVEIEGMHILVCPLYIKGKALGSFVCP